MILVDTSVWIGFLAGVERAAPLEELLSEDRVLTHPWIVGELAMGGLGRNRARILADLDLLPAVATVTDVEVREFIGARRLFEIGMGWVDTQLMAAALLGGTAIWTFDKPLRQAARRLELSAEP